jgi:hypothetical protein
LEYILSLMDKIDFQITDNLCEEALIELASTNDIDAWLLKYKDLFESISIKPEGLPSIANQHYHGVKYFYIGEMHRMYKKRRI